MEKKTVAKLDETKAAVKAVEEKAEEVKAVVEEKKETKERTVKAAVKDVAAETKEAAAKAKEAVKEKRTVRTAAKKTEKAAKEELKPEVFIQFQNQEAKIEDAIEKVKGQYVADGHRVSSIKSLQLYLKPEEKAAYYVINQKFAGRVDLF